MARVKKLRTSNHRVVLNRSRGGDTAINLVLLVLGLVMALPMYLIIINSLKPLNELFLYPPRFYVTNPTWDNFKSLFSLLSTTWVPFSRYVFNTVFISVAGVFGNMVLSSLGAYALSKMKFPGSKFFFKLIVYSLMFPATVAGIVQFIIISKIGLMDTYWALIIPAWGSSTGIFLMKQFMESNITDAVLESARLDGASEFRIFWTIAMPMVKPAWLTLIIFSFQGLWNMGASVYIQSEQLKTFPCAVNQILTAGIVRSGATAASSLILMIVPILVFVINQSKVVETMGSSGMKD
ncbi:MAG: carbohydrate ABC transporter permease [Clostridia bacterium]|nr:carbohydrate ABC transporter permease [Clostridia bacterium]